MEVSQQGVPAGNIRLQRPMMHYETIQFKRLQNLAYEYDSYNLPLFADIERASPEATKLSQLECIPVIGNLIVSFIIGRFISNAMEFTCLSASTKIKMTGLCLVTFILGFIPFFNVWFVYRYKPLYRCWQLFSDDIGSKGLYNGVSDAGIQMDYLNCGSDARSTHVPSYSSHTQPHSSYVASTATLNPSPPLTGFGKGNSKYSTYSTYSNDRYRSTQQYSPKKQASDDDGLDKKSSREHRGYSSFCPMPSNRNTTAAMSEAPVSGKMRVDSEYSYRYSRGDSESGETNGDRRSYESARLSSFPEEADFIKNKYVVRQSAMDNWPLK
ncbi:hypothetical protein IWW36_000772 [Coemansia brasiliensis]|uniref:Uncharacterized protein n=1 Tax=Coemansia brasiliensis TaxID=2650707 RepID=A0A9W8IHY8_9FUNG|nr:hypothetical protein IWW36_000772 [Coemansia brasiliensis]